MCLTCFGGRCGGTSGIIFGAQKPKFGFVSQLDHLGSFSKPTSLCLHRVAYLCRFKGLHGITHAVGWAPTPNIRLDHSMRPIVIVKSSGQELLPNEFVRSAIVGLLFGLVCVPSTSLPGDKNKSQIRLCHMHTCFSANTLRGSRDRPCSRGLYLGPRPLQSNQDPGKMQQGSEAG